MRGARALLASCLLLCAASASASAAISRETAVGALSLVELNDAAHAFAELRELSAAATTSHELEELIVRRLSAMTLAADADDATLRTQAQALFNLYRKIDPTLVATWGKTSTAQFEAFYTKVFPQILEKAKAKRAAAKAAATVVSTTKNPDGSTTVTKSDGSVTTTQADGTSVTTETDGTITTTKKDGTTVTVTKDGTTTTVKADGSTVTTTKDGTTTTKLADGSSVSTKTDGTTVTKKADGTTTTSTADGTTTTKATDGTTTTKRADGSTSVTTPTGTTTTTTADGRVTVTTSAPSTSGTTPGAAGTSGTTPGASGASGTTPGTSGTTPGTSGTTPGTSGTTPGTSGTTPGTSGTTPSTSGTTPGTSGTTPGTSGTTPSTSGTTPGTSGTTPGTSGTTPGTSGTTPGTSTLTVKSATPAYEVADSLSFLSEIYDEKLAANVRALRDNTKNIETIVQSSKGSGGSDAANQYQAPTVLESNDAPTVLGRRLAGAQAKKVDVLFCDIGGNAIWKWSASEASTPAPATNSTTTTSNYVLNPDLCTAKEVVVKVTAFQSGCSRQNHPEGCDKVYYKGCGGLTVSPGSNQIVVARTGGRSLGVLSYKSVGTTCQGRVVDAIRTYRGKRFNSPTYAEYSKAGHLYFTDSPFGLATSAADLEGDILDKSPLREIPFNGVYWLKNGETGSQPVQLVDCFMDRPNKIAFSPKQDIMYVTNSRKGNSYVKQFALKSDGSVANSSVLFNFTAFPELKTDDGAADGIKVDEDGYIYVALHKGIYVLSPQGTLIGVVQSTQPLSALAFGGGRMFITGAFGVVAQSSAVFPAVPPPKAKTECD